MFSMSTFGGVERPLSDLLKDALAVASEQRAGDKVAHLKAERVAARGKAGR